MPKVDPHPLDKHDLDDLYESGLTDMTIAANGMHTANNALRFPYRNLKGEVNCFYRDKPHSGKPAKYVQPKASSLRAYFPTGSLDKLNDGRSRVVITEGEKKALAVSQTDLAAVGIGGIWSGCKPPKTSELIDDLAAIEWDGRDVYIVFDNDEKAATRNDAQAAMQRLATALKSAGAREVYNVALPPGPNGEKQGVDDFLVANGHESFQTLIDEAEPVETNSVIRIIITPPSLDEAAYHGIIGDFLKAVAQYTEATDAGVLAHLLPAIGTLIGADRHIDAGTRHAARINTVLVGPTNAGRKGTSFAPVDFLLKRVDLNFWNSQRVSGLSSGEGLIVKVADRQTTDDEGRKVTEKAEKRLFVLEEEFSAVLKRIRQEGNVLSQIVRSAFDSGDLATLTVQARHAYGAHISIVGHITPEELSVHLSQIEMANGFGNRFCWFFVKSDKIMPRPQPIPDKVFTHLEKKLKDIHELGSAKKPLNVPLDDDAQARWETLYEQLREDLPGFAGAMIARRSSMVLRIALIYAVLDSPRAPIIRVVHLEAAMAVWGYCEASAMALFHGTSADTLCDKVLRLLSNGPMTRDDFNKHLSVKQKSEIARVLSKLEQQKLIKRSQVKHNGAGRPATLWEKS
jgi:hypothetical protein